MSFDVIENRNTKVGEFEMSDVVRFSRTLLPGELDIYVITFTLVSVMVIFAVLSFPMIVPLAVGALIGFDSFLSG
ncbi:hypothetical protein O9992_23575 [Vibrio lentus]|nr:hypothetical protein [Vibrio lentus]